MEIEYSQKAVSDLKYWKKSGQISIQKKIKNLIEDIEKAPFLGIGKPEALKHEYSGFWSRKINTEHRIVYKVDDNLIKVYSLKGHYEL